MADETYKPAGYCPHCGYAIDPGICPECGRTVRVEQLDASRYWVRRRRRIKRAIPLVIVLILGLCGWYVYARCNWVAWVPTRVLLAVQGDEDSRSASELDRRCVAGELNQDQITAYITNLVARGTRLEIRNPHPCDFPIQVSVGLRWPFRIYELVDWDLKVDGKVAGLQSGGFVGGHGMLGYQCCLSDLPVGHHVVELKVRILPNPPYVSPTTSKPQEICFTLPGEVVVDTSRVVDQVKLRWLPEAAEQVRKSAEVMSGAHEPGSYGSGVYLRLWPSPIPMAASIEVRPHGQGPYAKTRNGDVAVWTMRGSPGPRAPSVEIPEGCDRIDIRLVPDPKVAYDCDLAECLNAIVEWQDVPVFRADPASRPAPSASRPANESVVKRHPTLVYEATSTRPSE